MTETGWLVLRLAPASEEARVRLLAHDVAVIGALLDARSWFFWDAVSEHGGGAEAHCEVALRSGRNLVSTDVDDAVSPLLRSGTVTRVERAPGAPPPLDPALLPGGRVPSVYADLLCATARRSSVLFESCLRTGRVVPSANEIGREVGALYAALVPESDRGACAGMHASWLEQVAGLSARPAVPPEVSAHDDAAGTEYACHRHALDDYVDGFAQEDRLAVRSHVVARVVHIQTVTLLGPCAEGALLREAALVRALFSGTAADPVPENGA